MKAILHELGPFVIALIIVGGLIGISKTGTTTATSSISSWETNVINSATTPATGG